MSAAQDLVRVSAPSDAVLVVHEVNVTQESTETSDTGAIQLQRASTDGTGTSYIPKLLQPSDAAFGGSAVTNLTADTTAGDVLYREGYNILPGYRKLFTPEQRPVVPPSGRFVVRSDVAITAATLTCELVVEELG
ncbi:MAG: hypothetical protein GKS00_21980 [Alphaproteobacteria bacterium]|nr:hypothetical protein [Alphaproteobacteria bacterium]